MDILYGLWLFLPAYVANMSPVFTAKIIPAWKQPIDGGKMHSDGERVLGDGKTWRGLAGGAIFGGVTALLMARFPVGPFKEYDYTYAAGTSLGMIFLYGAIMGGMALIGDVSESYLKRRTGRKRGAPWFPFDQLDFVIFGLIAMFAALPLLASGFSETLTNPWIWGTIIVATPALHITINRVGYWLKLKEVPW